VIEEWALWIALAAAGLAAGFIDSVVGGGGIITLPALLAAGLPPHAAIATNKVAGTGASTMASVQYLRAGLVESRLALAGMPAAGLAGALGAAVVLRLPAAFILWSVAVAVVLVTTYVLARPRFGTVDRSMGVTRRVVLIVVALGLLVGFYDGVIGPGTGTFLLFGLVALTGRSFRAAAAQGRVMNWASNVGALVYFVLAGAIAWAPGLALAAGTMAGGWVGAHTGIRRGDRYIRGLFLAVGVAVFLRLVWTLRG
jgi:hypothetical protein